MRIDVAVSYGYSNSAQFANSSRDAMGCSTNWSREAFSSDEERNGVRPELVEEGREKIHGLEDSDSGRGRAIFVVECGNNEEDKIHEEADLHHIFSTIELVVDQ